MLIAKDVDTDKKISFCEAGRSYVDYTSVNNRSDRIKHNISANLMTSKISREICKMHSWI